MMRAALRPAFSPAVFRHFEGQGKTFSPRRRWGFAPSDSAQNPVLFTAIYKTARGSFDQEGFDVVGGLLDQIDAVEMPQRPFQHFHAHGRALFL